MRPIALGRKNWLFIGSQQAGERAATLMSLIESAKLNGHDAWAYLKDVLTKLPTWPNSRLAELLPHRWVTSSSTGSLSQSLDGLAACLRSRPASPRCAGRRFGMTVVMRQVKGCKSGRIGIWWGNPHRNTRSISASIGDQGKRHIPWAAGGSCDAFSCKPGDAMVANDPIVVW